MAFERGDRKFIIEYDGIFHDKAKDFGRDLEAKSLGYTTIRIVEIVPTILHMDRLDLTDKDLGPYQYETDTHIVTCNYFMYKDEMVTLDNMLKSLASVLSSNGVHIEVEHVTPKMIKEAEGNRKRNKKIVEVQWYFVSAFPRKRKDKIVG